MLLLDLPSLGHNLVAAGPDLVEELLHGEDGEGFLPGTQRSIDAVRTYVELEYSMQYR